MYKGKAIRKYILSKLLKANLNEKFCFLFFLKSFKIQITRDQKKKYVPIITAILAGKNFGRA